MDMRSKINQIQEPSGLPLSHQKFSHLERLHVQLGGSFCFLRGDDE